MEERASTARSSPASLEVVVLYQWSMRRAIMLIALPLKKINPRTLTVCPLLTLAKLCKLVPGCQYTVSCVLPANYANAESEATVSAKVAGPPVVGPASPDTVPTIACCCSFTFSAGSVGDVEINGEHGQRIDNRNCRIESDIPPSDSLKRMES